MNFRNRIDNGTTNTEVTSVYLQCHPISTSKSEKVYMVAIRQCVDTRIQNASLTKTKSLVITNTHNINCSKGAGMTNTNTV